MGGIEADLTTATPLHDLKLHPPEIVRSAIYGVALLGPAIGYALCSAA